MHGSTTILFALVAFLALALIYFFARFFPVGLWISAMASGVRVRISILIGMRFRRIAPGDVVRPLSKATKAGLNIDINEMEAHVLAGGHLNRVVDALIAAQAANIDLSFENCRAIDLAGRDVLEAVKTSVNPKVIETPIVAAVAKDGIELKAKARVTVRTNLDKLVGGAGEETIQARVGEGIVTTIGSSGTHKEVLENPDKISETVLSKGLDSAPPYELLPSHMGEGPGGRNRGAQRPLDPPAADRRIAQAKAEERRAMAVAKEQENIAAVQEMRARVVEAEAEVPRAMAEALRSGKLGVMDYYKMQNVQSDTHMRESIAGTGKPASSEPATVKK